MDLYTEKTIQLLSSGREDCSNLHSWGPGMRQCYIVHYIINGAGFLEYKGRCFRVGTNESFIIYPYTMARYYPDPAQPWEYTWVDFQGGQASSVLNRTCFTSNSPVCPAICCERLLPYYQRLYQLEIYNRNNLEANGLLHTILGIYGDEYPSASFNSGSGEDTRLSAAVMLVHTNYHKSSFNVENMCSLLNINRVTLYRLFRKGLETSPNGFLLHYRIQQSKKLLEMGVSVKDVSVSCGFSDPFYFSRSFKQNTGLAPSEYKKNNLKK